MPMSAWQCIDISAHFLWFHLDAEKATAKQIGCLACALRHKHQEHNREAPPTQRPRSAQERSEGLLRCSLLHAPGADRASTCFEHRKASRQVCAGRAGSGAAILQPKTKRCNCTGCRGGVSGGTTMDLAAQTSWQSA